MKYEFHVGDYVETKNDARGYVSDVDGMTWRCTQSSNDYMYVAGHDYPIPVGETSGHFNRIGQHNFIKKSDKIKPLHKEYNDLYSKINELVEAVNRLEEKVNNQT